MIIKENKNNTISFFFRTKNIDYSIERVFDSTIPKLEPSLYAKSIYVPYYLIKFKYIIKNLKYCKNNRSDINHITGVIHYCSLALPYSKTIITIHDLISVEKGKGLKKIFFWLFFFYIPIKNCKYVTCISNSVKESLIKYKCCPASKIIVIPNPVSDSFTYSPKIFNKENPRILHIGTRPNKNLENVIKSLSGIPCCLVIIGEISEAQKTLLDQYTITFINKRQLSNDEILNEYLKCDIVSFPSVYEGFGVPIIEGQAIGRPVLTSNIMPMKEVAGEDYYLVDPFSVKEISEGFKELIFNENLRNNLIIQGLKNVEKYKTDVIAAMYMELYNKILTSKN